MHCRIRSWADQLFQPWLARLPFDVSEETISIPRLPGAFQGFRIVQISDLHIDYWNRAVVETAIPAVNALKPDLLVCTGDFIANGPHYLGDVAHLLKQLHARHGKLACLGNHDYDDGTRSHGVRVALRKAGFDVLVNESTVMTLHHQQIQLAGADDLILGQQCLNSTSKRLNPDQPTLLLSHNPENFEAIARFRPDLVLSGHTHGGQIRMPQGVRRRFMQSPYLAGLYQNQASKLYVNRGLGSAIFVRHFEDRRLAIPTPRIAVRPEISVFTLTRPQIEIHHPDAGRALAS